MNKVKPRTKPAQVRREELMNAAESLFLEKGFEITTVNDIVKRAGVAKGTYYHYFETKNDILESLRVRYMQWFLAKIDEAIAKINDNDWPGKLHKWCECSVSAYVEKIELHDMLFHQAYHSHDNSHENSIIIQLNKILNGGVEAGSWTINYPELTCTLIYHGMHAAVDNLAKNKEYNQDTLGTLLFEKFLCILDNVKR